MKEIRLLIDTRWLTNQTPNNFKILLDSRLENVEKVKVNYVSIPYTFYNLSYKFDNTVFYIREEKNKRLHSFAMPRGFYDLKSYNKELDLQMQLLGLKSRAIVISLSETNGKYIIQFRKFSGNKYSMLLPSGTAKLLGFDPSPIILPRSHEKEGICLSDKPANFRPFDFFHFHCDFINKNNTIYNGRESDLLIRLPLKSGNFGDIFNYYPDENIEIKNKPYIDKINIWITDEFNRELNFNDSYLQLEISFFINE